MIAYEVLENRFIAFACDIGFEMLSNDLFDDRFNVSSKLGHLKVIKMRYGQYEIYIANDRWSLYLYNTCLTLEGTMLRNFALDDWQLLEYKFKKEIRDYKLKKIGI